MLRGREDHPAERDGRSTRGEPGAGRHAWILTVAVLVLGVLFFCRVEGDRVVTPLSSQPAPHLCWSRSTLGLSCPGCGTTRALIHCLHGRWSAAVQENPASLLVLVLLAGQAPLRCWAVARRRRGAAEPPVDGLSLAVGLACLAVMLAQWAWRLWS